MKTRLARMGAQAPQDRSLAVPFMTALVAAAALLGPVADKANAADGVVLFGNLDHVNSGYLGVGVATGVAYGVPPTYFVGTGPLAASFLSGPAVQTLSDVKLLLSGYSSTSDSGLTIDLYSDSGNADNPSPGSLIANIGNLSDNGLPSGFAVVDFPVPPPPRPNLTRLSWR